MELVSPLPPSGATPCRDFSSGLSLASFRRVFHRNAPEEVKASQRLPEIVEEANNDKVCVAVGKSFEKAVALLQWACRTFGNSEICILHVHQPSPLIPTLVGKLPASQANEEVISAFRNEERAVMMKRLYNYSNVCCQLKVKTSIITIEADQVQKGIVDLVNVHNIRKLVIGAIPDSMKVKKFSRKASYAARNAPPFSEILFVHKGKLVFTQKNSQFAESFVPPPLHSRKSEVIFLPSGGIDYLTQVNISPRDDSLSPMVLNSTNHEYEEVDIESNGTIGVVEVSRELVEFSLSDVQIATCNFSDHFKIGESGYGAVYKGELLDRTVAIKKLHTHNLRSQSEFLQQVQVLGKLRHRHLVTLLGICPEAWSLVYEYLPGGSLQDCLSRKISCGDLSWKTRARMVADIAKGLLFLHSSDPEKIVHGNLKPGNILIDSDNTCKICDFGIPRLILPQTLRCPSFARCSEPKGVFTYTDPEFLATGNLTPKSDIYSFGLIVLHILTGRISSGLANEVYRAFVCGNLESVLDSSAGEWPGFVARRLADLGIDCSKSNGRDRPELTSALVRELESLEKLEELSVPSCFLCPILQEIMYDPHVGADGFTYEGDAIREWLGSGRDTSPMTNMKLNHSELAPNNSLRLAIRDWLCKSKILRPREWSQ